MMEHHSHDHESPLSICETLRSRVITGQLRPGDRLVEKTLATEFGVSRIPIREAIKTLVGQGFLTSQPNRGTVVAEVDHAEAGDLLEIRSVLEPLAARQAATRCTANQIGELYDLVQAGNGAVQTNRIAEALAINSRFHDLIAVAAANPSLLAMIRQIRFRTDRFNNVDVEQRATLSIMEHLEIVKALESGNPLRAERLVALHVDEATDAYRHSRPVTVPPPHTGHSSSHSPMSSP